MPTKDEVMNFSLLIEDIVEQKHVPYIDAIVLHCESTGLEIEIAAKLVSNNLKSKLEVEAGSLRMVKRLSKGMLPL